MTQLQCSELLAPIFFGQNAVWHTPSKLHRNQRVKANLESCQSSSNTTKEFIKGGSVDATGIGLSCTRLGVAASIE